MRLLYLALVITAFSMLHAQDNRAYRHRVDSVKHIVEADKNDTVMVNALNTLSMLAWRKGSYEESDAYTKRAIPLAEKLAFDKGLGNAHNNAGTVAWYRGDYKAALDQYLRALHLMEKIGSRRGLSDLYNNVGMVHHNLGNFEKTIEYYRKSMEIDESLGAKDGVALSHNNIGGVYDEMGNQLASQGLEAEAQARFRDALKEYTLAQQLSSALNDKDNLALCYANMGNVYSEMGLLAENSGKSGSEMYLRSVEMHQRSLSVRQELGDQFGVAGSHNFLGEVCLNMKRYDLAAEHFEKALQLARSLGARERMKNAYNGLSIAYEKKNELKKAFEYRLLFTAMTDSIYTDEMTEQIAGMQAKYETEKKEQQIALLNREQDIRNTELNRQQVIIWSAIFILLVVTSSGVYAYNRFRVAKRQKRIIEAQKVQVERAFDRLHEKNQEVLDSIHYARRIQRALITPEKYIERVLSKLNQA